MAQSRLDLIINAERAIRQAQATQKALAAVGTEAKNLQTTLDALGKGRAKNIKITTTGLKATRKNIDELQKAATKLLNTKVNLKVSTTGISKARNDLSSITKELQNLSRKGTGVLLSIKGVTKTRSDIAAISKELQNLNRKSTGILLSVEGVAKTKADIAAISKELQSLNRKGTGVLLSVEGVAKTKADIAAISKAVQGLNRRRASVALSIQGIAKAKSDIASVARQLQSLNKKGTNVLLSVEGVAKVRANISAIAKELQNLNRKGTGILLSIEGVAKTRADIASISKELQNLNRRRTSVVLSIEGVAKTRADIAAISKDLQNLNRKGVGVLLSVEGVAKVRADIASISKELQNLNKRGTGVLLSVKGATKARADIAAVSKELQNLNRKGAGVAVSIKGISKTKADIASVSKLLQTLNKQGTSVALSVKGIAKTKTDISMVSKLLQSLSKQGTSVALSVKGIAKAKTDISMMSKLLQNLNKQGTSLTLSVKGVTKVRADLASVSKLLQTLSKQSTSVSLSVKNVAKVRADVASVSKLLQGLNRQGTNVSLSVRNIAKIRSDIASVSKSLQALGKQGTNLTLSIKGIAKTRTDISSVSKLLQSLSKQGTSIALSVKGTAKAKADLTSIDTLLKGLGRRRVALSITATNVAKVRTDIASVNTLLATLSKRRTAITLTAANVATVSRDLKTVNDLVTRISNRTVAIKTDAKSISTLSTSLKTITEQLGKLSTRSINIRTNLAEIKKLESALGRIQTAIRTLNKSQINIGAKGSGLGSIATSISQLQTSIAGLNASISTVGRTAQRSSRTASSAVGTVATSASNAKTSTSVLAGSMAAVGSAAGTAASGGIASLRGGLGKISKFVAPIRALGVALGLLSTGALAVSLVKLADSAKLIENRLKLVTRTSGELAQVQGELFRQAQDARTLLADQADLYQRIALSADQLGASQGEVLAATEAVSKAITLSASSQQAATATIIQFGQALSFGKLRGDELRSVLEQAPRLATALADGLGIARGELVKFGFDGKLASDKVLKALISQLPRLRKEFALLEPRIRDSSNTVINSMTLLATAVDDTTGAASGLARGLLNLGKGIESATPVIVDSLTSIQLTWIDLVEWFNNITTFESLEALGDAIDSLKEKSSSLFDTIGTTFTGLLSSLGEKLGIEDLEGAIGNLGDIVGKGLTFDTPTSLKNTADGIKSLQKELSELTDKRYELALDIQAADAQKELGKVALVVDGIPDQAFIDVEVNGEKARKEIIEVGKTFDALTRKQVRLEVEFDIETAEKQLREGLFQELRFDDKKSIAFSDLEKRNDLLRETINLVKSEGTALEVITDADKKRLDTLNGQLTAYKKLYPIRPLPTDTGIPGTREDITGARDPDADKRKLSQYLDAQRVLLATLDKVGSAEEAISDLRARAGDVAVDSISGVIQAYEALNTEQAKQNDFKTDAQDNLNDLKDEVAALNDLTAAEKIRQEVKAKGVRTVDEEKELQALKKQLLEADNLNKVLAINVDTTKDLARYRELAAKYSIFDANELQNVANETEAKEKLLATEEKLAEFRKDADDLIKNTVQDNKSDKEKRQDDLSTVQRRLNELTAIPEASRTEEDSSAIEEAEKAVEILEKGESIVIDFGITTESLIRGTAQAMSDAMSSLFFNVMQADFEDMVDNIGDTFKRTIDRMVADALAAKLTESLFSAGSFLGGLFGTGAAAPAAIPAAQFGAATRPGEAYRVNEQGMESFSSRGQRSLINSPANSIFLPPDIGRIDSASRTAAMLRNLDAANSPSVSLAAASEPVVGLNRLPDSDKGPPPPFFGANAANEARSIRGLAKGGFAAANELYEVNERGQEAIRMSGKADAPNVFEMKGKTYLKMGATAGHVLSNEDLKRLSEKSSARIPNRRFGGPVQAGSLYEVAEGGMPELLSIGRGDFMMNKGVSSELAPDRVSERLPNVQNINMTVVTPDPDGFRKSASQIQSELGRASALARRRNG